MRRELAVGMSVLALGCSGGDAGTADEGDADAIAETGAGDTGVGDTGTESQPLDTAPEADLDTGADVASEADAKADTRPTCTGEESEPNDTAAEAVPLATIDDCDGSGSTFSGVLSDRSDVDYWHYKGNDTFGCSVDATASTTQSVKLCVFVACLHGATRVNGCPKGTPTASESGFHGCCTDGPGEVVVDHTCTLVGTSDSADVYMRVEDPSASTCESYDVAYHF